MNQKCFIVGAGAIGCELLKQFAMMGIGCKDGNITITDMDIIERSNLNRQFLFRNKDIGKSKSVTASNAIKQMNPNVNITAHENMVGTINEHIYNEQFYKGLNFIANALDNVTARLYVDHQAVLHNKPLLESGTLGTKGNTQIIVPHLTESYGSSNDPIEETYPICTIKNFPYQIHHVIQWSRDLFQGIFTNSPNDVINYLKNPNKIKSMTPTDIINLSNNIHDVLDNYPSNYDDCIDWAYGLFHKLYRDHECYY
jgi:ubiquitin-activating enzyme E1